MGTNLTAKNKLHGAIPSLAALITALSGWVAYVGNKGGNTLLLVLIIVLIFLTAVGMGVVFGLSRKAAQTSHLEGQ